ncbi:MAG: radical SAM protein [Clostridia bacterium]|nr:radical SAM protein [Clostridia bacterium]
MNNFDNISFKPAFSHIYIEEKALYHPVTEQILQKFPQAKQIRIAHYKDVFCRSRQQFGLQKQSPKLILAKRENTCIYEGAKPCQSFGHTHFYYASGVMNCFYDCEYCYLQGMYPSANLVVFVNLEETFRQVEELLQKFPLYLCISYDTDLLALESMLGYVRRWIAFARKWENLTIEIRTKSANYAKIADLAPSDNVILAWTLSPQETMTRYEHGTATTAARLKDAEAAAADGWNVRLCFDPVLWQKRWRESYRQLITETFETVSPGEILDCSIGQFRAAKDALKRMRKNRPDSALLHYPYQLQDGVYQYDRERAAELMGQIKRWVENYLPPEKIFLWQGEE